jgi:hypothetical protein
MAASSPPDLIEQIFVAHASQIDGIKTVLPYEPDAADRLDFPLIAMFFLLPEATESETGAGAGPGEDYDWRWEVSLYVTLDRYKDAQIRMRDLAQKIVDNFREHILDYDAAQDQPGFSVDIMARELKRRIPPTPEDSDSPSYLRASWELRITGSIATV